MKEQEYDCYSEVKENEAEWQWHLYIPYGKITLLQGNPGEGKPTFIIYCLGNSPEQ